MNNLSSMTDSELLLEVARMKYPEADIERKYPPDMKLRAIAIHADDDLIYWYPEANTIHPLWAEYAMKYKNLRLEHYSDNPTLERWEAARDAYYDCLRASLTLRGMLEAVYTVLKEGE